MFNRFLTQLQAMKSSRVRSGEFARHFHHCSWAHCSLNLLSLTVLFLLSVKHVYCFLIGKLLFKDACFNCSCFFQDWAANTAADVHIVNDLHLSPSFLDQLDKKNINLSSRLAAIRQLTFTVKEKVVKEVSLICSN